MALFAKHKEIEFGVGDVIRVAQKIKEGDKNFVNKLVGKDVQKIPVTLGLYGNNGLVEILSGVGEGETLEF